MRYTKEGDCTCSSGYRGEVYHCPLHGAAPEMYELIKDIAEMKVMPVSYIELAKNIIAKMTSQERQDKLNKELWEAIG